MFFYLLLMLWIVCSALLWRTTDRRARKLPRIARFLVRGGFGLFFCAILAYALIPLSKPLVGQEPLFLPDIWPTLAYLWFPFVLQMTLGVIAAGWVLRRARRWLSGRRTTSPAAEESIPAVAAEPPLDAKRFTRRDALALAALAVPPLATLSFAVIARQQAGVFGVRRETLYLPDLPEDLDGLVIAHFTDLHIGHFFDADAVMRLADTINGFRADLLAMTGDLLDRGVLSRLPIALRFLDSLDRRHGLAMIEGNHDLHEDTLDFEAAIRATNVPLLLDEERTFSIPHRRTPVQFLGVSWGELRLKEGDEPDPDDPPRPIRKWTPHWSRESVKAVAKLRRADAFPIVLGHHPHTILPAADENLPLVLAGHTHGGQIMLTDDIGGGPLRFDYWRGTHHVGKSQLVICNGVGSWFPLRVNAPAEVLHLTLRSKK